MPLSNKTLLITGGTGSLGRKFIEVALRDYQPKKLIVFSRDELKQYEMRQSLSQDQNSFVRFFIGDVRDRDRLYRAFYGVDFVIHAAALKQVPACEYNPFEAVQTNIIGAKNVIDAAIDCGVQRVLAISTDKAVNPVNLYGATKLCMEKLFVDAQAYTGTRNTRFSVARYGNVVGSRGSVIPVFLKQRQEGRITITDPNMTRFWITLEQGVKFVIGCLNDMHGGEIFVPKIPSMTIAEMAKALAPDCKVEIIGIRPGEKVHEVLVSEEEALYALDMDERFVLLPIETEQALKNWTHGKSLPNGFRYASNENPQQLTPEDLNKLLGSVV